MTELLKNERHHFLSLFEASLENYFLDQFSSASQKNNKLILESMQYSLKSNGKRFRPLLAFLVSRVWANDFILFKSWFLALEFIHTYSLIHDDLPCMDNDDFRRGVPTNHKVYGDDIALLAGDSLIGEAFKVIADDTQLTSDIKIKLIQLLSNKIGPEGMINGQVLDMKVNSEINFQQLKQIHILKTGCLIQAAATGSALIANATEQQVQIISEVSLDLGLAFQIKDDLLDHSSVDQDFKSYVHILGLNQTEKELILLSDHAKNNLKKLSHFNIQALLDLIDYNLLRTH